MIEHIKKFQEEFKAKYGVEAYVQIHVYDARNEEQAEEIAKDISQQNGSIHEYDYSDDGTTHWFRNERKPLSELNVSVFFDKKDESKPVGDTMAWK
jgi:Uri superfamily endonuclease